jgi:2-hydroxychromene-2-carboxylate isomerase
MSDVTFFFDPVCPWTWRASRWLTAVADVKGLHVEWRPLSLLVLNGGPDEEHGAELEASFRALRLVEHLHRAGRHAETAALYEAIGRLVHEEGQTLDGELVDTAVRHAGLGDERPLLDDQQLDSGVRAATEEALQAAGPGVGSPVMLVAGANRGLHGPVLETVPDKLDALAIWDAVEALAPIDTFFEIKRGRN